MGRGDYLQTANFSGLFLVLAGDGTIIIDTVANQTTITKNVQQGVYFSS